MTYCSLICKARVIFASLTGGFVNLVYCSLEPTLALRLEDYPKLDQLTIGLIFGIQPLMYMLGTIFSPYIFPKWMEIRVTLISCLIGLGASMLLVGPIYPDTNLAVMLVGLLLSGAFMGPLIIPNMAEMMHATKEAYPRCDLDHANSLLSGLFNCSMSLGQAAGPLAGSAIYQLANFQTMCDSIGFSVLAFTLLYIICANGCAAIQKTCANYKTRNDSKQLSVQEQIEEELCSLRHSSRFRSMVIST